MNAFSYSNNLSWPAAIIRETKLCDRKVSIAYELKTRLAKIKGRLEQTCPVIVDAIDQIIDDINTSKINPSDFIVGDCHFSYSPLDMELLSKKCIGLSVKVDEKILQLTKSLSSTIKKSKNQEIHLLDTAIISYFLGSNSKLGNKQSIELLKRSKFHWHQFFYKYSSKWEKHEYYLNTMKLLGEKPLIFERLGEFHEEMDGFGTQLFITSSTKLSKDQRMLTNLIIEIFELPLVGSFKKFENEKLSKLRIQLKKYRSSTSQIEKIISKEKIENFKGTEYELYTQLRKQLIEFLKNSWKINSREL